MHKLRDHTFREHTIRTVRREQLSERTWINDVCPDRFINELSRDSERAVYRLCHIGQSRRGNKLCGRCDLRGRREQLSERTWIDGVCPDRFINELSRDSERAVYRLYHQRTNLWDIKLRNEFKHYVLTVNAF